ncbi:putative RNA recognition motif domain, nucleotide-binding alpha-beta plait domain superfamily [Helianthus annuus]|nr:putative RNA recognition motif domain, nucleotide-binding alpha-beta plait domain superfamily [Helianthus annuus]
MEGGSRPGGCRNIMKFFITNLPEGCTPWELKCGVASFGEVSGTFVAKKRDKDGRRFGFASFKDVKDISELEKALKGIKLGGCKMIVNVDRFCFDNGAGGVPANNSVQRPQQDCNDSGRQFNTRDCRSYRDVVGKGKMEGSSKEVGGSYSDRSAGGWKSVVVLDRTAAFRNLWGVAMVAKSVDLETLVDLNRLLRIAKRSQKFSRSWRCLGPWFSKLDAWEGQSLPFERVAWIRLLGVPLHLLESDVVKMIGERIGKVLYVPKSSAEEKDLSMARVGVLVGEVDRIKEFVVVRWKDRSFRILVEEELDVWVPDCLGVVVDVCPSGSSPAVASPVDRPVDPGFAGDDNVEVEESCMGEGAVGVDEPMLFPSKGLGSGEGHNEVHINLESFVDPDVGNRHKEVESNKGGIHYFKAGRKSKRFRKGGSKNSGHAVVGSPSGFLDSIEKGRPKKRNRVQESEFNEEVLESEDSDPFSLDNLLNQMRDNRTTRVGGQSPVATVNLNQPLNSDGIPVDITEGVEDEVSPEVQDQRIDGSLDPGILESEGTHREDEGPFHME